MKSEDSHLYLSTHSSIYSCTIHSWLNTPNLSFSFARCHSVNVIFSTKPFCLSFLEYLYLRKFWGTVGAITLHLEFGLAWSLQHWLLMLEFHWHGFFHRQLIDKLHAFLTTSLCVVCGVFEKFFEKSTRSMRSLWGSQTNPLKKTTSQHLDMLWCCEVISITHRFVYDYEVYEPQRQIRASGV